MANKLSSDWMEHSGDYWSKCRVSHRVPTYTKHEADCPCGIKERHKHCSDCGRLSLIGDWDKPGKLMGTINLKTGKITRA